MNFYERRAVSTITFSSSANFDKNEKVFPKFYFRSSVTVGPQSRRDDPALRVAISSSGCATSQAASSVRAKLERRTPRAPRYR